MTIATFPVYLDPGLKGLLNKAFLSSSHLFYSPAYDTLTRTTKCLTNDGSSQRKLLKWKGWFITLCNSRAIFFFFFALLSHFSRLWLFSRAASLSPIGLQAKRFHHLNMLSLKTRGPMLFLKATLFWHSSSFGWGKNPCLKLKAGDAVNILHQSPENASQTNVP